MVPGAEKKTLRLQLTQQLNSNLEVALDMVMVSHLSEVEDCFVFNKLKNTLQCMELADK